MTKDEMIDAAQVLLSNVDLEQHGSWRQSTRWERAARKWLDAYPPAKGRDDD